MLDKFFSPKQILSIQESNNKINIWEGAVRSGKTYASIWRFVDECTHGPEGQFAIITRTHDTFKRNILPDLVTILGNNAKYFSGKREMYIGNRLVHVIGADDARAESKIRGPTFAGIYIDEVSIIPEAVFKMALSRASVSGSKIFGTTNPDSPLHWLKKEFLNGLNADVTSFQFLMEDNPSLTDDYKDFLKRQYKGMWYQRYIDGQWVAAEGAVFDFFDKAIHVITHVPPPTEYVVGIDYGTNNPCAFVMVGYSPSQYPNMWVEDEYIWDSRKEQRQKTDADYATDLARFLNGRTPTSIYVDPSAASFKLELIRGGFNNIVDADNDVLQGVRFLSTQLSVGALKIRANCLHLIDEICGYMWDPKSTEVGKDKPLKQNDHLCVTGDTLVLTDKGEFTIKSLAENKPNGQLINFNLANEKIEFDGFSNASLTRHDAEIYEIELEDGKMLRATPDHKILTKNGLKELRALTLDDKIITIDEESMI